jgi:hypothetical protein
MVHSKHGATVRTVTMGRGWVGDVPKADRDNLKININQNGKQMSLLIIWLLVSLFSKPNIFPKYVLLFCRSIQIWAIGCNSVINLKI